MTFDATTMLQVGLSVALFTVIAFAYSMHLLNTGKRLRQ